MTKRGLLAGLWGAVAGLFGSRSVQSAGDTQAGLRVHKRFEEELTRQAGEDKIVRSKPGATRSPYPHVVTTGVDALAKFEELRTQGKGTPIIVGDAEDFARVLEGYEENRDTSTEEILASAAELGDSDIGKAPDLKTQHGVDDEEAGEMMAEFVNQPWPDDADALNAPTVTHDHRGKPLGKVHIILLPTQNSFEAPAYLRWGDWNENPKPETHVAMLKKWHGKYGAELMGVTGDVLNVRVQRKPATREEATELALEMFAYCGDIVLQGTGSIPALAASLMVSDYWFFWWD